MYNPFGIGFYAFHPEEQLPKEECVPSQAKDSFLMLFLLLLFMPPTGRIYVKFCKGIKSADRSGHNKNNKKQRQRKETTKKSLKERKLFRDKRATHVPSYKNNRNS